MNEPEMVKCSQCESEAWTEILMFAKVSALTSQNGQAGIAPVGKTYICMNCGSAIEDTEAVKELLLPLTPIWAGTEFRQDRTNAFIAWRPASDF